MHSYFIVDSSGEDDHCVIDTDSPALRDLWQLAKGTPVGGPLPTDLSVQMDKSHPGLIIPDFINNTLNVFIASNRLKILWEREDVVKIEWVPIRIYNHKRRIASKDSFIANVLTAQDCVDMERTVSEPSCLWPGNIGPLYKLYLDPARIDPELKLFRLAKRPTTLIIRDDLREAMEREGITGTLYIAMGQECFYL